jgi:hypothetical protein
MAWQVARRWAPIGETGAKVQVGGDEGLRGQVGLDPGVQRVALIMTITPLA